MMPAFQTLPLVKSQAHVVAAAQTHKPNEVALSDMEAQPVDAQTSEAAPSSAQAPRRAPYAPQPQVPRGVQPGVHQVGARKLSATTKATLVALGGVAVAGVGLGLTVGGKNNLRMIIPGSIVGGLGAATATLAGFVACVLDGESYQMPR